MTTILYSHTQKIYLPGLNSIKKNLSSGKNPEIKRNFQQHAGLLARLITKKIEKSICNVEMFEFTEIWKFPRHNPIRNIWVLKNFPTKIWKIRALQFFQKIWEISRQNILVQLAWQYLKIFLRIFCQEQNLRLVISTESIWPKIG